ncbi:hypothetical protein CABS03_13308 [Colletotrichum abscissum]|uniref:Uncharacterized protein n=2 Tax=Colletotrichum acutatum species complex TaxID=2707335 RepID=A0A9P9X1Y6_9PEZI|nr:hypothetical protein CABS02_13957 [Colletotrichum abscissum]KAK0367492.1 hypothetical protein CLIM01_15151 [Colletotrichum limetticola]
MRQLHAYIRYSTSRNSILLMRSSSCTTQP